MSAPDITAIVNLHAEGPLALSAMRSLSAAKVHAEAGGISIEVLAVLDNPTESTADIVRNVTMPDFRSMTVAFQDVGKSRNAGIEAARGQWIAFLDGDDLWGENWLRAAHEMAKSHDPRTIYHPQASVYFGAFHQIFMHVDMDDADFDLLNLPASNYWTALTFARRDTHLAVPYPATDHSRQIGYEDWGWHMETIARGHRHKCVPETLHAVRARAESLNRRAASAAAMPPPTSLFRMMLAGREKTDVEPRG